MSLGYGICREAAIDLQDTAMIAEILALAWPEKRVPCKTIDGLN
jgi:hypothetical protein